MADKIIDLTSHPMNNKMKAKDEELKAKDEIIEQLKIENITLRTAMNKVISTNELLKLQLNEAVQLVLNYQSQTTSSCQTLLVSLNNLKTQLPNFIKQDEEGE